MSGQDIWRTEGAKILLDYLSSATGEEHDAVVYDTKHEFDAQNPDAVMYIAALAMTKAGDVEAFEMPLPEDGSVVLYDHIPQNTRMLAAFNERAEREKNADGIYIPDSQRYCKAVEAALTRSRILYSDMTAEEQRRHNEDLEKAKRSDRRYMFTHYYLPLGFAVLTLIYIIYRLSS